MIKRSYIIDSHLFWFTLTNIFSTTAQIGTFANSSHIISIRPKFSTPQIFLHLWLSTKYLSCCYTLKYLNNPSWCNIRNEIVSSFLHYSIINSISSLKSSSSIRNIFKYFFNILIIKSAKVERI